jgi:3-hydroxyacyl-CoA dehydrogenase/enoyl-CoA hydratase/3-hydroxybutyryl-CoA epimerase
LFLRSNRLKKKKVLDEKGSEVTGAAIERLGLLGGGFMGADIAVVAADKGIDTRIREVAKEPLARGMGHIKKHFDKRARRIGAPHVFQARSRISGGLTLEGFETMDLVIEAVPEQLSLKQEVFAELESHVREEAILASNTSALPIGKIGEKLVHKDRLVGLHFFSPVPRMQLIEIVQAETTSPQTLATCIAFTTRLGKTPIVVKDGPGFFTTRALGSYLMGALDMVHAGHTIEQVEAGARKVGWPVGPLAVLDEVGIDVGVKVSKTLAEAFPDRMQIADGVDAFLAEERFGRKSKRGFYIYPDKGRKQPDEDVYRFFPNRPEKSPPSHPEELGERLTLIVALEAVRCLQEGIIASPDVGDIGAVFGFGYPPLRGGPFRHMRSRGLDTVLARAKTFCDRFGSAYEPPELLVELASKGQDFPSLGGEA